MRFTYQQYWPSRSDQTFTKLQGIICGRRLETFCRVSQTLLQASFNTPSTEVLSPNTSATPSSSLDTADNLSDSRRLPRLIYVLKTRVLPEAEALSRAGLDNQFMSNLRIHLTRLLLDMIRLNVNGPKQSSITKDDVFGGSTMENASDLMGYAKWAAQVLAGWYKAGTALPWRAVLEGTLRDLVCDPTLISNMCSNETISLDTRRVANISSHFVVFAQTYARRHQEECSFDNHSFVQRCGTATVLHSLN